MARIVVIDAIYDAAQLAKRVLEEYGHRAASFDDETDALESLRHKPVDLVVLDPRLKHSDGMAVLRRIRRLSPRIRVLVLTADSTKRARQEALQAGADAYCVKPIDNDVLVHRVEELLAGKE